MFAKLFNVSLFCAALKEELAEFQALLIALTDASPPAFKCVFLNVVALVKLSNASGLLANADATSDTLVDGANAETLATTLAPAIAVVREFSPPMPAFLGNNEFATPPTGAPLMSPNASFKILKPS